mmetsp:Transcript_10543/g.17224  ORF Transcript_10543/g.17224 Transcript_10543/m.17224 type:complete len:609 (+) Transcript_10543:46-1872(+)
MDTSDSNYCGRWGELRRAGKSGEQENIKDQLQMALQAASDGKCLRSVLQQLMEVGGDERSMTSPNTGLTKYHTPNRPSEGIRRSSCTSNVPSMEAFDRGVDTLRQLLLEAKRISQQSQNQCVAYSSPENLFRKLLKTVRERLRAVFELSMADCISLFPSGTDAELLPFLLGYLRAHGQTIRGNSTFTVVTAAGEVGSGTTLAAMGQHFANRLPSGRAADKNSPSIFSKSCDGGDIHSQDLFMRDSKGRLLRNAERDSLVRRAVQEAAAATDADGRPKYGCIIVHMVVGSKTGQCMPSEDCMNAIVSEYGDLILPVVDACQGRLDEGSIRKYLDSGRVVLCTGSKFFGGPPFSGMCAMSEGLGRELENLLVDPKVQEMLLDSELKDYISAPLISDSFPKFRSLLPQGPENYGVLMRWIVALHGIEAYFVEIPKAHRIRLLLGWTNGVRRLILQKNTPLIQLLGDGDDDLTNPQEALEHDEQSAALFSIVSFHCRCNRGAPGAEAETMTMDELRHVQFLMASDLTSKYQHLSLLGPAKSLCYIGQPVDLAPNHSKDEQGVNLHVLRVAASAPLMVRVWHEGLEQILTEDQALLEKLELILGNWFIFRQQL